MFLKHFSNTFRLLLLTAAVTCFIIYILDTTRHVELYLALTLVIVFFILCGVSYWQERSAKMVYYNFWCLLSKFFKNFSNKLLKFLISVFTYVTECEEVLKKAQNKQFLMF